MAVFKYLLIIIVLGFVLFFGIGFITGNVSVNKYGPDTKDIEKNVDSVILDCMKIETSSQKDLCYNLIVSKGIKFLDTKKTLDICSLISDSDIRDMCFSEINEHLYESGSKDIILLNSICLKIEGSDTKSSCQNNILFNLIPKIFESDPNTVLNVCKTFSGKDKTNCFWELVNSISDSNIDIALETCDLVNKEDKRACYDTIIFNVPERINKYPDKAIVLCTNLDIKVDQCYYEIAWELRDKHPEKAIEACRKIDDTFKKEGCYQASWLNIPDYVRSDPGLSIELCLESKTDYTVACLQSIAKHISIDSKSNAREACNQIEDQGAKDWCLDEYG